MPKVVVQERYERLVALQEQVGLAENQQLVGRSVELMVAADGGRKDRATERMTGRAPDNRLVHFAPLMPVERGEPVPVRPGDMVTAAVTAASPHHLVADGALLGVRRTRAGDAWAARTGAATPGVLLAMPTVGAPSWPTSASAGA